MRLRDEIIRSKKDLDGDLSLLQRVLVNFWMTALYLAFIEEWRIYWSEDPVPPKVITITIIALMAPVIRPFLSEIMMALLEFSFSLLILLQLGREIPSVVVLLMLPCMRVSTLSTKRNRFAADMAAVGISGLACASLSVQQDESSSEPLFLFSLACLAYFGGIELFDSISRANQRRFKVLNTCLRQDPVAIYDRFLTIQQRYDALRVAFRCNSGFIAEVAGNVVQVVLVDFTQKNFSASNWRTTQESIRRFLSGNSLRAQRTPGRTMLEVPYSFPRTTLPRAAFGRLSDLGQDDHERFLTFVDHYFPESSTYFLMQLSGSGIFRDHVVGFFSAKEHLTDEAWPLRKEFLSSTDVMHSTLEDSDRIARFLATVTQIPAHLPDFTSEKIAEQFLQFSAQYLNADCGFLVIDGREPNDASSSDAVFFKTIATYNLERSTSLDTSKQVAERSLKSIVHSLTLPRSFFESLPGYTQFTTLRLVGKSNEYAGRAIEKLDHRYSGYRKMLIHIRSSLVVPIEVKNRLFGYLVLHFSKEDFGHGSDSAQATKERQVLSLGRAVVGNFIESASIAEREFLPFLRGVFERDFHGVHASLSELVNATEILEQLPSLLKSPEEAGIQMDKIRDLELCALRVVHLLAGVAYLYGRRVQSNQGDFYIEECIENCLGIIRSSKGFSNQLLSLELNPEERDLKLTLDQYGLGCTLSELIRNAIKVGARVVTIRVIERRNDGIAIQVLDDGPGFEPSVADLIANEGVSFWGSTGVGLSLAKRFCAEWDISFGISGRSPDWCDPNKTGACIELKIPAKRIAKPQQHTRGN